MSASATISWDQPDQFQLHDPLVIWLRSTGRNEVINISPTTITEYVVEGRAGEKVHYEVRAIYDEGSQVFGQMIKSGDITLGQPLPPIAVHYQPDAQCLAGVNITLLLAGQGPVTFGETITLTPVAEIMEVPHIVGAGNTVTLIGAYTFEDSEAPEQNHNCDVTLDVTCTAGNYSISGNIESQAPFDLIDTFFFDSGLISKPLYEPITNIEETVFAFGGTATIIPT